jgi:hypothetical protein
MASFSATHPFAYHVFPLIAAREIWRTGALLGKDDLEGIGQTRRTTAAVDRHLGFSRFVHFYLPRAGTPWSALPILGAQLGPAQRSPASPHVLLVLPTDSLADEHCTICNWNIAVSRPTVPGKCKGGNWTRGTNPARIAEIWAAFRATDPTPEKARGLWGSSKVPVLAGRDIQPNLRLLRLAPRHMPELLLASPARVFARAKLIAFSQKDRTSLERLGPPPDGMTLELGSFPGYDLNGDPLAALRGDLDAYFAGERDQGPALDFDAIRT